MKSDIHPKYKKINIIFPDGKKFETGSTYSKSPDLYLDVDFRNHPAWSGNISQINEKAGAVTAFNKKFSGLNLASLKKN